MPEYGQTSRHRRFIYRQRFPALPTQFMMKPLHWISCACVTAAGMFFSFATAGAAGIQARGTKPIIDQSTESFVTGDLGVNFLSQYVARGIVFENEGVIAQPYADIYFRLYKGDGFVNKVSLNLAFWSSIHSEKTFAPMQSRVPEWFEQDYKPGLSVTFAKNFTLSSAYCWYTSPSGAFRTPRAINSRLDFNDADLLGTFALHPYFTYLRELENKVATVSTKAIILSWGSCPRCRNSGR